MTTRTPVTVFLPLALALAAGPAGAVDPVRPNYVDPGGGQQQRQVTPPSTSRPQLKAPGGRSYSSDCHGSVREHYVPEFGRVVRHYHTGPACRPILVDPDDFERRFSSDCHRDARSHRLPGSDGPVLHRHVGDDCEVRVIRGGTPG